MPSHKATLAVSAVFATAITASTALAAPEGTLTSEGQISVNSLIPSVDGLASDIKKEEQTIHIAGSGGGGGTNS